jgi:hypothetical protein
MPLVKAPKIKAENTQVPKGFAATQGSPAKKDNKAIVKEGKPELGKLNGWFTWAMEAAQKKQWEWFIIDQFVRGNHNIKGNPQDNSIEIHKSKGGTNYPINMIYTNLKTVRGYVTRHKPKVEIDIEDSADEQAKIYARRANKVLERDNKLNNFRKINKEWAYFGVKYGIGYRQMGYDPAKHVSQRWTVDPNDLLIGSKTGKMEDAPYLIKTVVRTREYVENKFPKTGEGIAPDNKIAASPYKELSMQLNFNDTNSTGQDNDKQTVILKECWYRLFEPNKLGGYINKTTFTTERILKEEETPYTEYPFIAYEAEILPNEAYPDGNVKHVIAPQRMLNLLNQQMLEYNHLVNKGRWKIDKGAGFKIINSREGSIVQVNPGKNVVPLDIPAVNPMLSRQLDLAMSFIEKIGSQSSVRSGIAPYSGASGDAIESLQMAGADSDADLRDNFEDALAQEATWILKMYSLFEDKGVVMTEKDQDKEQQFGIVGTQALKQTGRGVPDQYFIEEGGNYCDICAILPENHVKVSVYSELGETKQARQNLLFKLLEAGLPLKVVLEHLEFANTDDILQRVAEEALGDSVLQQMGQPQQQLSPGAMPPAQPETVPMPEVNAALDNLLK